MNEHEAYNKLSNREWRLSHLYTIQDTKGKLVQFKPNNVQKSFYKDIWYLNIILKSRQQGISTAIEILMLDFAVFNINA